MKKGFALFPEQASSLAQEVDALYAFLVAVSLFFVALIFFMVIFFAIRYRRKPDRARAVQIEGHWALEIAWSLIPLGLTMVMFFWGAKLYFAQSSAPSGATEIFVVGKQWMWKIQHPAGPREINELHIPVGETVKLTMTSEDVIHSFYIPAFRVKMDVLPGRFTQLWFKPIRTGTYHLFCAEYCGAKHSGMKGRVIVMNPADYEQWLGETAGLTKPLAARGGELYQKFRCYTCHDVKTERGPALEGLYGASVKLKTGETVLADEAYIRESILRPAAKNVEGYAMIMPTFEGLLTEEQIVELISYIKSLSSPRSKER